MQTLSLHLDLLNRILHFSKHAGDMHAHRSLRSPAPAHWGVRKQKLPGEGGSFHSLVRMNLVEEVEKGSQVFTFVGVLQHLLPVNFESESTGQHVDSDKLFLAALSACALSYSGRTCKLQRDVKICLCFIGYVVLLYDVLSSTAFKSHLLYPYLL